MKCRPLDHVLSLAGCRPRQMPPPEQESHQIMSRVDAPGWTGELCTLELEGLNTELLKLNRRLDSQFKIGMYSLLSEQPNAKRIYRQA